MDAVFWMAFKLDLQTTEAELVRVGHITDQLNAPHVL